MTIASSDSGGGAGIQADLKAFAAAGCHGMSAIVALTAQNTVGVTAVHELPPDFVRAQLEAVWDDIGVDAAKTGMLFSRSIIEVVAEFLRGRAGVPLVVDPVMVASSGARLLQEDAVEALVRQLFPLATVVTPNLYEAEALVGAPGPSAEASTRRRRGEAVQASPVRLSASASRPADGRRTRRDLAERIHDLGAPAVIVTGGHGEEPVDHLFDGRSHVEIPVKRHDVPATHGAGCTHSATIAALLARGEDLITAAGVAAMVASRAVEKGLTDIGRGEGPVNVLELKGA